MPKDPSKNVDRYKVRGGHLNEYEFEQKKTTDKKQGSTPANEAIASKKPQGSTPRKEAVGNKNAQKATSKKAAKKK